MCEFWGPNSGRIEKVTIKLSISDKNTLGENPRSLTFGGVLSLTIENAWIEIKTLTMEITNNKLINKK